MRERRARLDVFPAVVLVLTGAVGALLIATFVRLAVWTWHDLGTRIPSFYEHQVFGSPALRHTMIDTVIVVGVSALLATFIAAVLAWLNERTDASIGAAGRVLPLVPFLMPAIALPLGWLFLASPSAGLLNVTLRSVLRHVGVHSDSGPLNVYSWSALIFLYVVVLCGFAYLVVSASMRNLDRGLEEAAVVAGAGPTKILLRIVMPAMLPGLISAFLLCVIVGLGMVAVPITVGGPAHIDVLAVLIVNLMTSQSPPPYGEAFLFGLLLTAPIIMAWWLQRRVAAGGRFATIGGRASAPARLRLGRRAKIVGRVIFFGYVFIAVVLPLLGLAYVAGLSFWSGEWPNHWDPIANLRHSVDDPYVRQALTNSVWLGVAGGAALVVVSHLLSYTQRLFRRLGHVIDALTKLPAVIAHILLAVGLLLLLGGKPFNLLGSVWLLFIAYFVAFLPFATVMTTASQQEIGRDIMEVAKVSASSDARTLRSIVTPLTWQSLVGAFLLMYVLVSGETTMSLVLASRNTPVVGFVMLDEYNYGSFSTVASFALLITVVNLACVAVLVRLLGSRGLSAASRVRRARGSRLLRSQSTRA